MAKERDACNKRIQTLFQSITKFIENNMKYLKELELRESLIYATEDINVDEICFDDEYSIVIPAKYH